MTLFEPVDPAIFEVKLPLELLNYMSQNFSLLLSLA